MYIRPACSRSQFAGIVLSGPPADGPNLQVVFYPDRRLMVQCYKKFIAGPRIVAVKGLTYHLISTSMKITIKPEILLNGFPAVMDSRPTDLFEFVLQLAPRVRKWKLQITKHKKSCINSTALIIHKILYSLNAN